MSIRTRTIQIHLLQRERPRPAGIFGTAQGARHCRSTRPGEYHAHILATYTDNEGHLWVCAMRHAGVVYPDDSPIVAHGKKLTIGGEYVDRGETQVEGYVDPGTDTSTSLHVNFPYHRRRRPADRQRTAGRE